MTETSKRQGKKLALTKERQRIIDSAYDEFLAVGLSTEPADRKRAEAAFARAYKVVGREPVPVIWADSPAQAQILLHVLKNLGKSVDTDMKESLSQSLQQGHLDYTITYALFRRLRQLQENLGRVLYNELSRTIGRAIRQDLGQNQNMMERLNDPSDIEQQIPNQAGPDLDTELLDSHEGLGAASDTIVDALVDALRDDTDKNLRDQLGFADGVRSADLAIDDQTDHTLEFKLDTVYVRLREQLNYGLGGAIKEALEGDELQDLLKVILGVWGDRNSIGQTIDGAVSQKLNSYLSATFHNELDAVLRGMANAIGTKLADVGNRSTESISTELDGISGTASAGMGNNMHEQLDFVLREAIGDRLRQLSGLEDNVHDVVASATLNQDLNDNLAVPLLYAVNQVLSKTLTAELYRALERDLHMPLVTTMRDLYMNMHDGANKTSGKLWSETNTTRAAMSSANEQQLDFDLWHKTFAVYDALHRVLSDVNDKIREAVAKDVDHDLQTAEYKLGHDLEAAMHHQMSGKLMAVLLQLKADIRRRMVDVQQNVTMSARSAANDIAPEINEELRNQTWDDVQSSTQDQFQQKLLTEMADALWFPLSGIMMGAIATTVQSELVSSLRSDSAEMAPSGQMRIDLREYLVNQLWLPQMQQLNEQLTDTISSALQDQVARDLVDDVRDGDNERTEALNQQLSEELDLQLHHALRTMLDNAIGTIGDRIGQALGNDAEDDMDNMARVVGELGSTVELQTSGDLDSELYRKVRVGLEHILASPIAIEIRNGLRASIESSGARVEIGDNFGNAFQRQLDGKLGKQLADDVLSRIYRTIWRGIEQSLTDQGADTMIAALNDDAANSVESSAHALMRRLDAAMNRFQRELRSSIQSSITQGLGQILNDEVAHHIRNAIATAKDEQIEYQGTYWWGSQDMYWIGYYRAAQRCGAVYSAEQDDRLHILEEISRSCGWWYPRDGLIIACDRPQWIYFDDQQRLHNMTGAAIKFRDGWSVHSVHGCRVPGWVVDEKEKITPDLINAETNAEVRRVMVDFYGAERYCKAMGAKVIDEDPAMGRLWRTERMDDEPILMVELFDSSLQADGSRSTYFERVHPFLIPHAPSRAFWRLPEHANGQDLTIRNAVASRLGLLGHEYDPEIET